MNSRVKSLKKENEKLDKLVLPENNEIYTDIIVYLRTSRLSDYNQELVRNDIVNMIIDGQERGESIAQIIGASTANGEGNKSYKQFCDDIIEGFPPQTTGDKIKDIAVTCLICIVPLLIIDMISQIIVALVKHTDAFTYTLTLGNVIDCIILIVIANIVVTMICKNAFEEPKIKNKVAQFFLLWLICVLIIGGVVVIGKVLVTPAWEMSMLVPVAACIVAYIARRIVEERQA